MPLSFGFNLLMLILASFFSPKDCNTAGYNNISQYFLGSKMCKDILLSVCLNPTVSDQIIHIEINLQISFNITQRYKVCWCIQCLKKVGTFSFDICNEQIIILAFAQSWFSEMFQFLAGAALFQNFICVAFLLKGKKNNRERQQITFLQSQYIYNAWMLWMMKDN